MNRLPKVAGRRLVQFLPIMIFATFVVERSKIRSFNPLDQNVTG